MRCNWCPTYPFADEVRIAAQGRELAYAGIVEPERQTELLATITQCLPVLHELRREKDTEVALSTLVDKLNERFGTDFTKADQLFFDQVSETAASDEKVVEAAQANRHINHLGLKA